MKEKYSDDKYYPFADGHEGLFYACIRNYKDVISKLGYNDYVKRFRYLAARGRLSPQQRPKMSVVEFARLKEKLSGFLALSFWPYMVKSI